jgi:hypothetical protein
LETWCLWPVDQLDWLSSENSSRRLLWSATQQQLAGGGAACLRLLLLDDDLMVAHARLQCQASQAINQSIALADNPSTSPHRTNPIDPTTPTGAQGSVGDGGRRILQALCYLEAPPDPRARGRKIL